MLGVSVGAFALLVVLSVFNGFESLIKSMYNEVDADLVITSVDHKFFKAKAVDLTELNEIAPWNSIVQVCQEKVLLQNDGKEQIGWIKGVHVEPSDADLNVEKHLFKGQSFRNFYDDNWFVVGQSLAYHLGLNVNQSEAVRAFVPNLDAKRNSIGEHSFYEKYMYLSGIYTIQSDYDASYAITNLNSVQNFINRKGLLSSIELRVDDSLVEMTTIQEHLKELLGPDFLVRNRFEQQAFLYKILQTEKWAIFLILSFILLIATFNIVASISMIILEKRKDILSLWAMGASEKIIKRVFFFEGFLISLLGAIFGLSVGLALCYAQQKFGFFALGQQGDFIVNSYPVEVQFVDVLLILTTVLAIGTLVTLIPIRFIGKKIIHFS